MQTVPLLNQFSYALGQATSSAQEANYPENLRRVIELLHSSQQGLTAILQACASADPVVRLKLLHILHVALPYLYQASLGQLSTVPLTAAMASQSALSTLVTAYTEYLQTKAFNHWQGGTSSNSLQSVQGLFKQLTLLDRVCRLCIGPPAGVPIVRILLAQTLQDIQPDLAQLSACLNAVASNQATGPALLQLSQRFETLKRSLSEISHSATALLKTPRRSLQEVRSAPQLSRQSKVQRVMEAFSASPATLFQQGNLRGLRRPPQ